MSFPVRALYEINTAVWLHGLRKKFKEHITLASIPSEEWDAIAQKGYDTVWLMGIWERSPAAIEINLDDKNFIAGMRSVLPDLDPQKDIIGSAYSIRDYDVSADFGGQKALAAARFELKKRGIKLIVDYVPNHLAPDHEWTIIHPEYFVQGSEHDLEKHPTHFLKIGESIIARGRDPEFDPWSDVMQLNVFSPALRNAVIELLRSIADQVDGVRCDMAMLLLSSIFKKTWGDRAGTVPKTEFWTDVISSVRKTHPSFLFIAETYWDTEEELLHLGFDYCYDKTLYDHLVDNEPVSVKNHLSCPLEIQDKFIRFIENHDEPRATTTFRGRRQFPAAIALATVPGAHMFYEGQCEGLKTRVPVQLIRGPKEKIDQKVSRFYNSLFDAMKNFMPQDQWQLCHVATHTVWRRHSIHPVLAWEWTSGKKKYLAIINWSDKKVRSAIQLKTGAEKTTALLGTPGNRPPRIHLDTPLRAAVKLNPWQAAVYELL